MKPSIQITTVGNCVQWLQPVELNLNLLYEKQESDHYSVKRCEPIFISPLWVETVSSDVSHIESVSSDVNLGQIELYENDVEKSTN